MDALAEKPSVKDEIRDLVRAAFDELFYHFALFDHSIKSELVTLDDVRYPASYYVRIMGDPRYRQPFADYLNRHQLIESQAFLKRCPAWIAIDPA